LTQRELPRDSEQEFIRFSGGQGKREIRKQRLYAYNYVTGVAVLRGGLKNGNATTFAAFAHRLAASICVSCFRLTSCSTPSRLT